MPKTAKFTIELTPSGVRSNMVLEDIDPAEAMAILAQGADRIAESIFTNAELDTTKNDNEKGNN